MRWSTLIGLLCAGVDPVVGAQSHGLPGGLQHSLGAGQQVDQRRLGQPEQRRPAHRIRIDQTALLEAAQMLGDRGLGQPDLSDQLPDPSLPNGEATQNRQPVGSPSERNNAAAGANSTLITSPAVIAIQRCYRPLVTNGQNGCMLVEEGRLPPGSPAKGGR